VQVGCPKSATSGPFSFGPYATPLLISRFSRRFAPTLQLRHPAGNLDAMPSNPKKENFQIKFRKKVHKKQKPICGGARGSPILEGFAMHYPQGDERTAPVIDAACLNAEAKCLLVAHNGCATRAYECPLSATGAARGCEPVACDRLRSLPRCLSTEHMSNLQSP
jgi:hypothetical protein